MNPKVVCIAGAHRSGTSMLTRLLHTLGLVLGPEADMMPAAADNPDGFWENLRFVRINDELLNAVGAAWDLPPSQEESFESNSLRGLRAKAGLLIDSFAGHPAWGWKDPRNCLTLPFWRSIFPQLKVIIIVRNPLEVAYSMHRRNGTSYALGLRLWEIYNRRLLAHTQPEQRLITDYQVFFDNPRDELERLSYFAGLSSGESAAAADLVTHTRRHTKFNQEQLIDAGVSEEIIGLYNLLVSHAAATKGDKGDTTVVSADQDTAPEPTNPLAGAASRLNLAVPESEDVRRELSQRRGSEVQHQEKIRQLQLRIEALTQDLAGEKVRAALEIGRRDGRVTELQAAYAHLDQVLLREQETRNNLLAEVAKLRHELAEQTSAAEKLVKESQTSTQELEKMRERFYQTNRLLHDHSIQLAERETEAASLNDRLRKQLSDTKRLIRFLEDTARAADLLRTSRRWKIGNLFAWLSARSRGKELHGFGHLDKVVSKFQAWRGLHPETSDLDNQVAALKARQTHTPLSIENNAESSIEASRSSPPPPTRAVRFQNHASVEVSIVIPVFNEIAFTHACLASLQAHAGNIPFEVILVDDCSTDETERVLKEIPGLIYIRKNENSGFIASCNLGAERARAPYLVFLNNDTEVNDGWLEALRRTFLDEPEAGLVGSKLVYPDGRLQEAGGIIWKDGSGWNRGKFEDPARPEYNYLREVDYCSAASVMIPKLLFESLGGFDPKYSPAYYEDTDLAFKVRAAGRKVLYQPLSNVIHYEGTTGGTDVSAGTKKYQELNRATFASAWEHVLAAKPRNGDLAAWESLQPGRKRILVVDHHLPMPDRDSGSLRMFQILSILSQLGHRISFLPDNLADIPPYGDELRRRGIEVLHHPYVTSGRDYLRVHGEQFEVVILSRCDFARKHVANVRLFAPQARVIFDTVDLHFLREEREAELTRLPELSQKAAERRRAEYALIDQADETWVVSPVERDLLRRERPNKSIEIVSNIVDVPGSALPYSLRRDILFIGSFKHPPNTDAVLFFAREIFPLVRQRLPDLVFYIIGEKAPPEVVALAEEGIIVTGFQPDVSSYFNAVRLSVAPLRYGAGVKGKINQSMGYGVPTVATSIAVEGMGLTHRRDVFIADTPDDFASALIQLYQSPDLWERISQAAIEKTRTTFSPDAAEEQLNRLLSDEHISLARNSTNRAPSQREPFTAAL